MGDQILKMVNQHREDSFFTHAEFNDEPARLQNKS